MLSAVVAMLLSPPPGTAAAPPAPETLWAFPPLAVVLDQLKANEAYTAYLEEQSIAEPKRHAEWDEASREAAWARHIWLNLKYALEQPTIDNHRYILIHCLGAEAYYRGQMPAPYPLHRFQERNR